ncbi:MAG TPA: 30S ribosomal protein S4 [Clostridia bacterium]|nr:30S ribosomal protein S4 [Clostridia bacterium]
MSNNKSRFKKCRRLGLNVVGHPKAMKRAGATTSREKRNLSNYGLQLLEKQRLREYYNVKEKVMKNYVKKVLKSGEPFSHALIKRLELRVDNIVYRLGFASSIYQARQMVVHQHILLNGKKVKSPSHIINVGDEIKLKGKSQSNQIFNENFNKSKNSRYPYLEKNTELFLGKLTRLPNRNEIPIEIKDHLVVEFYSKVK